MKAKVEGQDSVLRKHDLGALDVSPIFENGNNSESLESVRKRLTVFESHNARSYFKQIFGLFPESIRPEKRTGFKAYDGLNNVFNFAYYVLKCRVHKALLKAKLEPYLGFLHSTQVGKPSLVCDFQELYRFLIDDFLIERRKRFHKNDFVVVTDFMMKLRMGKRIHLCSYETDDLASDLNQLFDKKVEIPRMKYGYKQTLDTLICEEALLLAKFLRGEREIWIPRIAAVSENGK